MSVLSFNPNRAKASMVKFKSDVAFLQDKINELIARQNDLSIRMSRLIDYNSRTINKYRYLLESPSRISEG